MINKMMCNHCKGYEFVIENAEVITQCPFCREYDTMKVESKIDSTVVEELFYMLHAMNILGYSICRDEDENIYINYKFNISIHNDGIIYNDDCEELISENVKKSTTYITEQVTKKVIRNVMERLFSKM